MVATSQISAKTRLEFREYFVGTSIARVDDAFALAGIAAREDFIPSCGGARRCRVEQYYAALDLAKWSDIRRLLVVFEHVLLELEQQVTHGDEVTKKYAAKTLADRRTAGPQMAQRLGRCAATRRGRNLQSWKRIVRGTRQSRSQVDVRQPLPPACVRLASPAGDRASQRGCI